MKWPKLQQLDIGTEIVAEEPSYIFNGFLWTMVSLIILIWIFCKVYNYINLKLNMKYENQIHEIQLVEEISQ